MFLRISASLCVHLVQNPSRAQTKRGKASLARSGMVAFLSVADALGYQWT